MGIEQKLGNLGVVTYRLEDVVNWGRTNAMWPLLFGLACCAIEMMSSQAEQQRPHGVGAAPVDDVFQPVGDHPQIAQLLLNSHETTPYQKSPQITQITQISFL